MPSRFFRDIRIPWSIALPWQLPAPFRRTCCRSPAAAFPPRAQFRIPEVHQVSTSVEHEVANRVIAEVSYSFVHGQKLIRARDMNLPPPTNLQYPVFDSSG